MKGGLAVMVELADALAAGPISGDVDVGFLFFGREELPITESALLPFLRSVSGRAIRRSRDRHGAHRQTDRDRLSGQPERESQFAGNRAFGAPMARSNAIHAAIRALGPVADLPARDVGIDGLIVPGGRERHADRGRQGGNVVPDQAEAR